MLYKRNGKAFKRLGTRTEDIALQILNELGQRLPFQATNAFLSAHRTQEGYFLYLINPHVFKAKSAKVALTLNTNEPIESIFDAVLALLGLCLGGFHHNRTGYDQREIDRGRMESVIHQPFSYVLNLDSC